jgi:hypothetical protein
VAALEIPLVRIKHKARQPEENLETKTSSNWD